MPLQSKRVSKGWSTRASFPMTRLEPSRAATLAAECVAIAPATDRIWRMLARVDLACDSRITLVGRGVGR